jgi:tetratricopeptide (TPR) repeat protein
MTDPKKRHEYEDLLRNRLPDVLGSVNGSETDDAIERQLDAIETTEIDDTLSQSILAQTSAQIAGSALDAGDALGAGLPTPPSERPRSGLQPSPPQSAKTFKTNQGPTDMKNSIKVYSTGAEANAQRGTSSVVVMVVAAVCLMTIVGLFKAADVRRTQLAQQELDDMVDAIARRTSPSSLLDREERIQNGNYDSLLAQIDQVTATRFYQSSRQALSIEPRGVAVALVRTTAGDVLETGPREKRRVTLPDGSVLFINEQTKVTVAANRRLKLHRGDVFVEVVPVGVAQTEDKFVVETPNRSVTALGTKFAVTVQAEKTDVLVSQGKVRVSGVGKVVAAGQKLTALEKRTKDSTKGLPARPILMLRAAPRFSNALFWTRDLIVAGERPLIPFSKHAGGSIIVVDPKGQEMKLSLRKFHVDVHIEDGFARTTIDQTYFNHTYSQLEGTFRFPLPADASLSRLAMYVNGTLMEGGMAERDHARNVFEEIRHTRRDPALLEWVDGSTFKMRVFPLEARQEKRLLLSYTQRLSNDYGRTVYRFPAGHNMQRVRDWSTSVRVKSGGDRKWFSPSHLLKSTKTSDGDLVLEGNLRRTTLDKDLVVEITDPDSGQNADAATPSVKVSTALHEGYRYLMLRYRPDLKGKLERPKRNWVFLFEASADRNPVLARVQLDVIQTILDNAEHHDTFNIISASTKASVFKKKNVACTNSNIKKAVKFLESAHLVGALNLHNALSECGKHWSDKNAEDWLVHVGSAVPVLGERGEKELIKKLPKSARYVGVGIGKRWARPFLKAAAAKTGGHFTQINPDEKITWRAIELLSTLNAPRLMGISVAASDEHDIAFLGFGETIAQGQEVCAVTRFARGEKLPKRIIVTGHIDGQEDVWKKSIKVKNVKENVQHLPRTWARLEIDRLVSSGAAAAKNEIIALSKNMYVMSPFTSLLVLETEAMYKQYGIDRGRKDHWALYPAPPKIKVVRESGPIVLDLPNELKRTLEIQKAEHEILTTNIAEAVKQNRPAEDIRNLRRSLSQHEDSLQQVQDQLAFMETSSEPTPLEKARQAIVLRRRFVPRGGLATESDFAEDFSWGLRTVDGRFEFLSSELSRLNSAHRPILIPEYEMAFRQKEFLYKRRSGRGKLPSDVLLFNQLRTRYLTRNLNSDEFILGVDPNVAGSRLTRHAVAGQRLLFYVSQQIQDVRLLSEENPVEALARLRWTMNSVKFANDVDDNLQISLAKRLTAVIADVKSAREISEVNALRAQERIEARVTEAQLIESIELDNDGQIEVNDRWATDFRPTRPINFGLRSHLTDDLLTTLAIPEIRGNAREQQVRLSFALSQPQFLYDVNINANPEAYFLNTFGRPVRFRTTAKYLSRGVGVDRLYRNGVGLDDGYIAEPYEAYPDHGIVLVQLGLLKNIADYCPGLETTQADIQAVLANAADPKDKPVQGQVDPVARQLIEKARAGGWETLSVTNKQLNTSFQIVYNGAGQFRVDRKTTDGLREKIICDGKTLWHLYPELGIGTKRPFTRFHELNIQSLIPWHLPTADELSRGADIKLVGQNVVRVCPLKPKGESKKAKVEGTTEIDATEEADSDEVQAEPIEFVFEFVFNKSGRLSERRVLNSKTNKVLARLKIADDGTLLSQNLVDDKIKSQEHKLARTLNAKEPRLGLTAAQKKTLVVLQLPFRTTEHVFQLIAKKRVDKNDEKTEGTSDTGANKIKDKGQPRKTKEPLVLTSGESLQLISAYFAENKVGHLNAAIKQHFFDKNDHRIGFAVLLASANQFSGPVTNATDAHKDSPLASFIQQYAIWRQDGNRDQEFVIAEDSCEFLRNLASAHNIWARWNTGRATNGKTVQQIDIELNDALEFIDSCKNSHTAWNLIGTVFQTLEKTDAATVKQFEQLVKSTDRFRKHGSNMSITPLLLRVRLKAGQRKISLEELRKYVDDQVEMLGQVARDGVLRKAFADVLTRPDSNKDQPEAVNGMEPWNSILTDAAKKLIANKQTLSVIHLADTCWTEGDRELAESLFELAIDGVSFATEPRVGMLAIKYLTHTKDWKRAEQFLQMIPDDSVARKTARYWRSASTVAQKLERENESIRRLEKALDIEFAGLPQNIPLKPLRDQYTTLMARYATLLAKSDLKDSAFVADIRKRVIKAADRWRGIDPDVTALCYHAGLLFHTLGEDELAWSYWTTPLASKPRDSSLWRKLAVEMNNKGLVDRSHEAYTQAFACEPTNPDILWHHAATLKARGRRAEGNALVKKIVEGQWQPRFSNIVKQAKQAVVD